MIASVRSGRQAVAFERIQARLAAIPDHALAPISVNVQDAALAVIGIAERVTEPSMYALFQRISDDLFDISHVDHLADVAWGTLYTALMAERVRHARRRRGPLPPDVVDQATAIRARMRACCEYYLADEPNVARELARLRAGTGHRDLASDLLGYATLYQEHRAVLEQDAKHYQATDAGEAIRTAEHIYTLLGRHLTAVERSAGDQVARAWTLLLETYNEVSATGRWLLRNEPARAARTFPSLFVLGRGGRPRRRAAPAASAADVSS